MSAKALVYAEETLGVHKVWENVQRYLHDLDELLTELDKAQDSKRQLDEEYADREVELISEMRGTHPSYSDTRFRTELKGWERTDKSLRAIRVKLNTVQGDIQGLGFEQEILKLRIRANTSRMEELGGYFHYLAAVKNQAEQITKRK
jgi:hypothetical protein